MGREARCRARRGKQHGDVTALLETSEIIVRGAFRAVAPLAGLRNVRADGGTLRFWAGGEDVALELGKAAASWGDRRCDRFARRRCGRARRYRGPASRDLARGVPFWVVYTKGKNAPLGETAVRAMLRERGLIDLKVASVSPTLTALKFARTSG